MVNYRHLLELSPQAALQLRVFFVSYAGLATSDTTVVVMRLLCVIDLFPGSLVLQQLHGIDVGLIWPC